MAKLHELLAVEADLKAVFNKIVTETVTTFTKREDHFKSFVRTLDWFEDDMPAAPEERKAMDTTVDDKLNYQRKHIIRYFDAVLQKEATNQAAKADIMINDAVLAKDVPAGFLLGLEKLLRFMRQAYEAIPTLPPSIEWVEDADAGDGVYRRKHPEKKYRTEQAIVPQILYDATPEHPAQVDKISETKNIGLYTRNEWCAMWKPATKSQVLGRIDNLLYAVKKARQRANATAIVKREIGKALFDYIEGK